MLKYTCPCCGYQTLNSKHEYDICPICFWEDDWYQADKPYIDGGANHISLYKAQINFRKFGAWHKESIKHVRKPNDADLFDNDWKAVEGLTIKEISEVFKLGLMIGYFRLEEISTWVDSRILNEDIPNNDLIEVSFSFSSGINEIISRLGNVTGKLDLQKPAKIMLGLVYKEMVSRRSSINDITHRLYSLSNILIEFNIDKAILSELCTMDDYYHIYTVEEIKNRIEQLLEKYEDAADQFINQVDYEIEK